jgi:catechol 2,3-dioxygenase-like lactoylglutathione lyase family enzyme
MPGTKEAVTTLGTKDAVATIAVKDLERAKKFYEGVLGFKRTGSPDSEMQLYKSGNSTLMVYRSPYAGTNQATVATWGVGAAFDGIVQDLKAKGVAFEHYDMPGVTRTGDVHEVPGRFKAVWFKDSDGNILHVNSG